MAYFCTDPEATAAEILEAVGGPRCPGSRPQGRQGGVGGGSAAGAEPVGERGLLQPERLDVQPGGGVGMGAEPTRRWWTVRRSPWDEECRRPSHADKRKALQRQVLREEIRAVLTGRPTEEEIQNVVERLLDLAA